MTLKLLSVLSNDELHSVPEGVRNKLESHLEGLAETEEQLKSKIAKNEVNSDKIQFQLEKEVIKLKSQLETSNESELKLKTSITELEEHVQSLEKQLKEIQHSSNLDKLELESLKRNTDILHEEKQTLLEQLDKRKEDIDKLNTDIKNFLNETTSANEEKHASIAKAEEAQMRESNLKHQVTRLEQEKKLLEQQIADLNVELTQKNHELSTSKREKTTILLELESQLQSRTDEVFMLERQVEMLKDSTSVKDARIETLADKIRSMNQTSRQTEEQFNVEQNAQNKLTELYKKSSEDNESRVVELVDAFEKAQVVLREMSTCKEEVETKCATLEKEHELKMQLASEEMDKLRAELQHANDLCQGKVFTPESLESLFPTAATTSKVINSGMTLTELYAEYVKAQEEISNLRVESFKLNYQLKQIVAEVEENTPVYNQRMKEYHKSIETISCLRTQLASAMTDYENMLNEKNEIKRNFGHLDRENNRLKSQVTDLNHQVQVLLKEVEEARGGFVKLGVAQGEAASGDDTTADKVISRHLVTFRDIMEIQTRNQQLLAVLRQLSEDHEEQEKRRTNEKMAELEKELENALGKLEELQKGRIKQAEMVNSIIRQRDMFRILLSHHGVSENVLGSPEKAFPLKASRLTFSPNAQGDSPSKSNFQQIQTEFDQYRKEKAENERMLNEQLEKARNSISDLRIEQARLSSQLEYSEERIGILKTNSENYKKEANFLQEKNLKHSALITKHQQTIQSLQHETMELQEKLAKSTIMIENVKSEKEVLKNAEQRLLNEKESLHREQLHTSQVLANLQSLQNNLERLESESKRNLQSQNEKYEKENAMLKLKLESANEDYKSAVAVWEKKTKELEQKIEAELERNTKMHDELVNSYAKLHEVNQELSAVKSGDKSFSPASSPFKASLHVNELKNVKEQLMESQAKAKALQNQLEISRASSERYSKMCYDLEIRLKELDEINAQLKLSMESALNSSTDARTDLENQLDATQKANRGLIEENVKLTEEKDAKILEITTELNSLMNKIASSASEMESAKQIADQARQDSLMQTRLMEETQEKYERELLLHAQNVQALASLKAEHQKCLEKESELISLARKAEAALEEHKTSWAQQEKALKSEQTSLQQRVKDLEAQCSNLMDQMELMGTQLKAVQAKNFPDLPSTLPDVDLRDTQHLLEIIKYVKKDKEIISTQFDSTQAENIRLKLRVQQLTSDFKDLQTEFNELQTTSQVKAASEMHHSELLRKVEMLGLLTDSNSLLRMEKTELTKSKEELEKKLSNLHEQIQPLNDRNKALTSQLENLITEKENLQNEVKSWQSRTNQLLEHSHRIGPQEYKNMTRDLEELKSQKIRLSNELQRKQTDAAELSSNLLTTKKDLEIMRGELNQKVQEIERLNNDSKENQKTMVQVKKIGRKYKTQFDELTVKHDELVAKMNENVAPEQNIHELQKKIQELEKSTNQCKLEANAEKENAKKSVEEMRTIALEKDEKAKKLLAHARQRITLITNQRNALNIQLDDLKKEHSAFKTSIEEDLSRASALKSQFEAKMAQLEADIKTLRENNDTLTKKNDELCLKIAQQQKQSAKPTAVERGSGSEPLTANIKPLSTPTQPSGSGLRHAPHAASQATRSTPTASIRPMAIGTVATPSQARMAAVLPTTAATPAIASTSEDDVNVLSSGPVPQATVQPTPATATVAPTTLAPTLTPSSHTPVISEVVPTPSSSIEPQASQMPIEPAQNIHIASTATCLSSHATALVSPRVEGIDVSDLPIEPAAPTATVIVSPPTTQTQLVQPNIKRKMEDSPGSETPESGLSAQKRVRMISEGSQTNQQQASVATSVSMNVAIIPVATVVSCTKVAPAIPIEPREDVGLAMAVQPSTSATEIPCEVIEETTQSTQKGSDDEELEIIDVEAKEEDQNIDWEAQEEKTDSDFEVEVIDEEVADQMEEFEDEHLPAFAARSGEDEDMTEDIVEDVEEMNEPPAEVPHEIMDILDNNSDNQMESDSNSLQQAPSSDQGMAPPASPMTQVVTEATDSAPETSMGHVTVTIQRRVNQQPRFPIQQERLPSVARQQLTPFTIQGQPASFEEGDDSIVPSTPTLFVPRRNDGFAEAVSSPHVPSVRFLFSSADSSPTQQGLSQLASQGALGVDDTRMDLSQFDEGSARTVPTTPVQVSPPSEQAIAEVPEQFEQVILEPCTDSTVPSIKIELVEFQSSSTESAETVPSSSTEQVVSTIPEVKSEDKPTSEEAGPSTSEATSSLSASGDSEASKKETELASGKAPSQVPPAHSTRKPIVWEKDSVGPSSAPAIITTSSTAAAATPLNKVPFSPPTPVVEAPTISRARRMRFRGSGNLARARPQSYARRSRGRSRMF